MRNTILLSICFIGTSCYAATVPPVLVTPSKTLQQTTSHAPKLTIHRDDMKMIGASSLSQVLQELGNVQLRDNTGTGSNTSLSMRGFGANAMSNSLFLINGIPIVNPDMSAPNLNNIPVEDLEFVEVISGSESVLYGDQAVGGVVSLITRQDDAQSLRFSCSAGSYDNQNCYAALRNHTGGLQWGFTGLKNSTDNYRDNNNYSQNNINGYVAYPYASGRTSFNYQVANENMRYPGSLTAAQVRQNRRQAQNDIDFFRDWNGFFHLRQEQQLNANWRASADLVRREMHGDGVLFSSFNQSRLTYYIKPQIIGEIGKALVTAGLDAGVDEYRLASTFGITSDQQQRYGLFGLLNYAVDQKLSLSAGVRGAQQNNQLVSSENNNMVNRAVASTLGLSYLIQPKLKTYIRRASSFRFPKADENAPASSGVAPLRPQRGVSYETGAAWDWRMTSTNLNIYQLNLRDEIAFDPTQTTAQPFGANRNLSPTVRRGFTLAEKIQATSKLALNGQYNYVNARFNGGVNSGNRIPLVSASIFHAGAEYAFTENWHAYGEAVFTGNQYSDNDDANAFGLMGGYTIYNFNVRYHMKRFSAILRANNVFNKYYYFYTVINSFSGQSFYPAPGRNLLLTLSYDI